MSLCGIGTIHRKETHRYLASIPQALVRDPGFRFQEQERVKVTLDLENDRLIFEHFKEGELERFQKETQQPSV